ncbi:MAG: Gfo/Idh/MocA family oxidoreductase [Planctomycetes bacterium]|nr:Gfo/Idh/MocA family oxidoreductase [Planctomycetota bacterium]
MRRKSVKQENGTSRRGFLKTSSLLITGGAVASGLSVARAAHSYGSDEIRIGLIGCGGRGTGAAVQALNSMAKDEIKPNGRVRLVAMGDAFGDRLQSAYRTIKSKYQEFTDVPPERQFVGFDAYRGVLQCDVDLVILATPPGFRPLHFEAAVHADKHVFMEKPVGTDAPGIRRLLAANEVAKSKSLMVAVGLQRRHEAKYKETISRLRDGAIGDIVCTRVYWNGGGVWMRPRQKDQSELEYQMRNWYYFNWLSGDHICEQHIHNLDVSNWLMGGPPADCNGQGGRQVRTGIEHGEIYDHHFVEYTYPSGAKMFSQCRHIRGCWNTVAEHAHGTNGHADISGAKIYGPSGDLVWRSSGGGGGHQEEHYDLFAALRRGDVYNEGNFGAYSTMTAIMGRMATYSGKTVNWEDALNSELALADFDNLRSFDDPAPVKPLERVAVTREMYDIAMPGKMGAY